MRALNAKPGDDIVVTSNSAGRPKRYGTVLETVSHGALRVRWDDGHESVFFPGSNCRVADEDAKDRPVTLGSHIDLRVTETSHECRAVATLLTTRGTFEAGGASKRHPDDANVPLIGEELAIGRALEALGRQIVGEANAAIGRHEVSQAHLLAEGP